MGSNGSRRGWIDVGIGFVLGLVATGVCVAILNSWAGWQRVGAWERAIEERNAATLEGLMLRQIDLSRESLADGDPLSLAGSLAFSVTPKMYEHYLEYVVFLLENDQVARFNTLRLQTGNLILDLSGANLRGLDLENADFQGAILERVDFAEADLSGASFFRAVLRGADLSRAGLDRASFCQADMTGATVNGVSGAETDFSQSVLVDVSMTGISNLRGARFDSAVLVQANLEGSRFPGAVFDRVDFTLGSAVNVDFSEIESMNDVLFTGANLAGTRWNAMATERAWLVGTQGLTDPAIRDLRTNGGVLQRRELLDLIDVAIIKGFRTQVDEDAELTEREREAIFFDLLRQYWMR